MMLTTFQLIFKEKPQRLENRNIQGNRDMTWYLEWLRNSFRVFLTKERNKQVMEKQPSGRDRRWGSDCSVRKKGHNSLMYQDCLKILIS